jgi:hypothetical protein
MGVRKANFAGGWVHRSCFASSSPPPPPSKKCHITPPPPPPPHFQTPTPDPKSRWPILFNIVSTHHVEAILKRIGHLDIVLSRGLCVCMHHSPTTTITITAPPPPLSLSSFCSHVRPRITLQFCRRHVQEGRAHCRQSRHKESPWREGGPVPSGYCGGVEECRRSW